MLCARLSALILLPAESAGLADPGAAPDGQSFNGNSSDPVHRVEEDDNDKEPKKKKKKKKKKRKKKRKKRRTKKKRRPKKKAPEMSPEEQLVRDSIHDVLAPSKFKFMADGRVSLKFDFSKKDSAHDTIFFPNVSEKVNSPFRWSIRREEYSYYNGPGCYKGLRVSDKGFAVINCWFNDAVEAEVKL